MTFLLTRRNRRRYVRTIVLSTERILQPTRYAFHGPELLPSILTSRQLSLLCRRINRNIRNSILDVLSVTVVL